jgi:hypothetical protein
MAGQGAMQQEQAQSRTQARSTPAKPQVQAESKARNPEVVSGKLVNVSDAGAGRQNRGQGEAANAGDASVQFSERSGTSISTKG